MRERTPLRFAFLRDYPDFIPQVAAWWCTEWGLPQRHRSFDDYVDELAHSAAGPETFPVHLLALSEDGAVGVATLKDRNALQSRFPDYQYWLSGVYVAPAARGRGIATALCLEILDLAVSRGITRVHLQTEALDGGLYARIGFTPIEQLCLDDLDILIMARDIPRPH